MSQPVTRVLLLPEEIYQYLVGHVFEKHVRSGIPSDELSIANAASALLRKAQIVDYTKLGKADIERLGPQGVAVNLKPGEPDNDIGESDPPASGASA